MAPLADRIEAANRVAGRLLLVVSDDTMHARLAEAGTYAATVLTVTEKSSDQRSTR